MQSQIVVIDANSQLHRVAKGPMGIDGAARWWLPALHALCTRFAEGERLDMYVAFDGPNGSAWRTELEPSYKSDRDEKSDGMRELLAKAVEATMEAGYQVFKIDDAEADDVVAALVTRTKSKAIMVSSDKDLFQLLEAGRVIQLRNFGTERGNITTLKWYSAADFLTEFEFDQSRWPLWKAIAGDKSDNLSGVPQCGPVCATNFCRKYATVAELVTAGEWYWPEMRSCEKPNMRAAVKSGSLAKWEQITTLRRDCLDLVLCEGGA